MNYIHPTSIIGNNVTLGTNNYIGPFCYIEGNTTIGDNNRFEAYCSIGTPAEHRDYFTSEEGKTIIGSNNILREFVTIHSGTKTITTLGDQITILNHSHVAHDVCVEDKVTISANVTFAGHSYVMEGANIAMGSIIHQFQLIGAYSMLGMGCVVTKKTQIEPGKIYVGSPAKFLKENIIGLERGGIDTTKLTKLVELYNNLLCKL